MNDTVILAYFQARHEGELARGFLERAGIAAALLADDAGGAEAGLTFVNPARLVTRKDHAGQARLVLSDAGYGELLLPPSDDEAPFEDDADPERSAP